MQTDAPRKKLTTDILWTIGSFAILAISGIAINTILASSRDVTTLGVFNQSYAVYIIASQIGTLGIHYSVVRNSALYADQLSELASMLGTGVKIALLLGLVTFLTVYFSQPLLAKFFKSDQAAQAAANAAFGLLLFPINKVLMAYLNGLRQMKLFSFLQATRYLSIMGWVVVVAYSDAPTENISFCFIFGEAMTLLLGLAFLNSTVLNIFTRFNSYWAYKHLHFGCKSIMTGVFVELNSRVDVLIIGALLTDRDVGIYSFAAMIVEGMFNIFSLIRINLNPILVNLIKNQEWATAKTMLSKAKKLAPAASICALAATVAGFYFFIDLIIPGKSLSEGTISLAILLCGLTAVSAFVPFDNILMMAGFPGIQTVQQGTTVISNILLNFALIPLFHIEGSALATSMSYVIGIGFLILFVKKKTGWNMISNSVPKN